MVRKNWSAALLAASVIACFLLGSIFGRLIIELGARTDLRRIASFTLVIECVLLVAVRRGGSHALKDSSAAGKGREIVCPLQAMLAAATGLQTATLTRIGPLTIHTTFVTGMLNKLAQMLSGYSCALTFTGTKKSRGLTTCAKKVRL